jgi:hypothetical protein
MPDDKDPPNNVIPFPNNIPYAVAQGLRDYYASLLSEPMPEQIAEKADAFSRALEKLASETEEKPSEPDEPKVGKGGQP